MTQEGDQIIDNIAILDRLDRALSAGRIDRYMAAAGGDRRLAVALYVWNARLCEAFYLPLQFAEIVTRNAMLGALVDFYGPRWFAERRFFGQLPPYEASRLDRAIKDERDQHGEAVTGAHVTSALHFGFWVQLATKRFDHLIWREGLLPYFPNAGALDRQGLFDKLDSLRQWRNRVAHHKTVFDKNPTAKMNLAFDVVGLVCRETRRFVARHSRVGAVLGQRPRK